MRVNVEKVLERDQKLGELRILRIDLVRIDC